MSCSNVSTYESDEGAEHRLTHYFPDATSNREVPDKPSIQDLVSNHLSAVALLLNPTYLILVCDGDWKGN